MRKGANWRDLEKMVEDQCIFKAEKWKRRRWFGSENIGIQILWTVSRHEWTQRIAGMRKVDQLVSWKGGSKGFGGAKRMFWDNSTDETGNEVVRVRTCNGNEEGSQWGSSPVQGYKGKLDREKEMEGVENVKGLKGRNEKRWVGGWGGRGCRKGPECVFSGLKAHDSAWLIRKSSQETLVCSSPSSPLLSFRQYTLSRSLLALLHSLPLIYDFRCSYLHK